MRDWINGLRTWFAEHGDDERGSVSVWAATSAVILMICIGIAIDLGGQVTAQQRAHGIAAQAARTAGQRLDASAVTGAYPSIAVGEARAAAQAHLAAAGVAGTVSITGGTTVEVHVTDTYDPLFLGVIGISDLQVSGEATARVVRTMGGSDR